MPSKESERRVPIQEPEHDVPSLVRVVKQLKEAVERLQAGFWGASGQWVQTNGGGSTAYLPLSGGTLTGPLIISTDAPLKLDSTYPTIWFHDNTPAAAPASPDLSMTAGNGWFRFGNAGTDGVITDLLFVINPMIPAVISYIPFRVLAEHAEIEHSSPQLRFHETDAAGTGAGRYRFHGAAAGAFYCQKTTTEDWSSAQNIWSYSAATNLMNVDVPFRTTAGCIIEGLVGGAGTAGLQITSSYPSIWFRDPGQSPNPDLYFTAGNGNMRVGPGDAAGNISATPWSIINSTSGWSTSSDPRLKENIEDIPYGLDAVMALRPVAFDWIADGGHDIGFLAPEVEKIIPEVVEIWEADPDIEGQLDTYAMRKDALVAVLVRGMQQQQEMISSLTSRVLELEARL